MDNMLIEPEYIESDEESNSTMIDEITEIDHIIKNKNNEEEKIKIIIKKNIIIKNGWVW